MALGFIVGGYLTWRWAPKFNIPREKIEGLVLWILVGSVLGARIYYVVHNDFGLYVRQPWRIIAVWESGLAFFGGLFGGIAAAYLYSRRTKLTFSRVADLFAPAIPVGAAIGRITCSSGSVLRVAWRSSHRGNSD